MKKIVKSIDELCSHLKEDSFYFLLVGHLGDTYSIFLFKENLEAKYKNKIIFIVRSHHKFLCEMFEIRDFILCENALMNDFCYPKGVIMPNVKSIPAIGKFYIAHPLALQKRTIKGTMLEYFLHFFDLPKDIKIKLPTKLPKMSANLKAKIRQIAPLEKIILFLPEAQSCPCLPTVLFQKECERLTKQGYFIIANIPKHKEYKRFFTHNVYELDLSAEEVFCLALACAGVVAVRSGMVDVIAAYVSNLKHYYTTFHHFYECRCDCISTECKLEEILIYDEPLYKDFIHSKAQIYNLLPFKLYQRYATKGFLRKLRTPFTLYFKLYQRHKRAKNVLSKDEWLNEFLLKEFTQTYEYQLGLALKKACENFFVGGFIFFVFTYLKIRKQKDKAFVRVSNLNEIFEPRKSLYVPENMI